MIVNFADREAEAFHRTGARPKAGWQGAASVAARKLDMISAAKKLVFGRLRATCWRRLEGIARASIA